MFFFFLFCIADGSDTGVELKSYEEDKGVKEDPEHEHQDGADRSVDFVVVAEIIDKPGEAYSNEDHKYSGYCSAGGNEFPSFGGGGANAVQHCVHRIEKHNDEHPPGNIDHVPEPCTVDADDVKQPAERGALRNDQGNSDEQQQYQDGSELQGNEPVLPPFSFPEPCALYFTKGTEYTHYAVGGIEISHHEGDREQPVAVRVEEVVDHSPHNHIGIIVWGKVLGQVIEGGLYILYRDVGHQSKQEDEKRRNGQEEVKGDSPCPVPKPAAFGFLAEVF